MKGSHQAQTYQGFAVVEFIGLWWTNLLQYDLHENNDIKSEVNFKFRVYFDLWAFNLVILGVFELRVLRTLVDHFAGNFRYILSV